MSTEPELRDAMRRMLAPVSPSWVAAQVGVTRQQVDRWKNGHYVTAKRVEAVAAAIAGLLPPTQKNAAPGVPARLNKIEQKLDVINAALTPLDRFAYVDQLVGRLEELLRPPAEDPPAKTEESDQAGVVPPDQGAE